MCCISVSILRVFLIWVRTGAITYSHINGPIDLKCLTMTDLIHVLAFWTREDVRKSSKEAVVITPDVLESGRIGQCNVTTTLGDIIWPAIAQTQVLLTLPHLPFCVSWVVLQAACALWSSALWGIFICWKWRSLFLVRHSRNLPLLPFSGKLYFSSCSSAFSFTCPPLAARLSPPFWKAQVFWS